VANSGKLLLAKEVAAEIGIHRMTLYRWRKTGKGPKGIRMPSGRIMFHEADIRRFIDTRPRER